MTDRIRRHYPETAFFGFTDIDGTIAFYIRVNAAITGDAVVLDVGCGRGALSDDPIPFRRGLRTLRGKCRRVIGIDVDPVGAENPFVDEFRLIVRPSWPVDDASIDVCVADWVLEHVPEPDTFFGQVRRVLKPGGLVFMRTANLRSYVGLMSKVIPNRLHGRVLSRAQRARKEEDVFPTVYRCNTRGRIQAALRRHGLAGIVYGYEAEPSYLNFNRLAYALGVLHQRFAPSAVRPSLFVFARKIG